MPVTVRKHGSQWLIVERSTGKVKGRSTSRTKALISAAYRNRAIKKR